MTLRDEIYGGSWDFMEEDLRSRLQNRPHIYKIPFRLANRIRVDLGRIRRLRAFEARSGINLSDVLKTGGRS